MEINFNQFSFESEQQILTKNGEVVPLNDKALKLLALFLEHPNKVHSKSEILDKIWNDRVVSDQVVFQNISHLRAIFGSHAIKTYSKKGYQWQLPQTSESKTKTTDVYQVAENQKDKPATKSVLQQELNLEKQLKKASKSHQFSTRVLAIVLILPLLSWVAWLTLNQEKSTTSSQQVELIHIEEQQLGSIEILEQLNGQRVNDSPYEHWQASNLDTSQWLVSKIHYEMNNGHALRFYIQGSERGWGDYIYANTASEAEATFKEFLEKIAETDFFNLKLEHTAVAELTVLHNKYSTDELINRALAEHYLTSLQFEKAQAVIDVLLHESPDKLTRALLLLLRSKVLAEKQDLNSAKDNAEEALFIFAELNLPQLEANSLLVVSWYYMDKKSFLPGIQVLNKAINKARLSGEKRLELNLLLAQATMSWKNDQKEMALSLVDLAKQIIELHSLDQVHNTPVLAVEARFSLNQNEQLDHYQASLAIPYSPMYQRNYYTAARSAQDIHIKEGDWKNAFATMRPWQRQSFVYLSQARILIAQAKLQQGLAIAARAFEQAKLDHFKIDALNSAILLIKYSDKTQNQIAEYRQFITREATQKWLYQNQAALAELDLI